MLERISEISVENRFKESKKKNNHYYGKSSYESHKETEQDSLSLSPAFKIASHFHLRIKEVLQESSDKFKVVFTLNDFEFEIKVDLVKLFEEKKISLMGKFLSDNAGSKNLTAFWANFKLDSIAPANEINLTTKYSYRLIDKVKELSIGSDLHIYNETSLHMLVEDFELGLTDELYNLCSIAVKLTEKLFEQNISEKFGISNEQERFFTLQLIKQNKLY